MRIPITKSWNGDKESIFLITNFEISKIQLLPVQLYPDTNFKQELKSLPISFSFFFFFLFFFRFLFVFQRPTNFMAFRTAKVLVFLCLILTVVVTLVVQSGILNVKVTMQRFLHAPKEKRTATTTVKVNSVLNASQVKLSAQLNGSI